MTNGQRNTSTKSKRKDSRILWNLHSGDDDNMFPKIVATTNAHQGWEILEKACQDVYKVRNVKLQILKKKLEALQMRDVEAVDQFMTQVIEVVNKFRTLGEDVPNNNVVENIIRNLPPSFIFLMETIEEIKYLAQFGIEELTSSMSNHESRIKGRKISL